MAHSPRTAFISYARDDDQPLDPGELGWVSSWVRAVEHRLTMVLPEPRLRLVMDLEQPRHLELEANLRARIAEADLFLAVLSPNYLASSWCQRELQWYLGSCAEAQRSPSLIGFEMHETELAAWPPALQARPSVRLWYREREGGPIRLPGYPRPPVDSSDLYWIRILESAETLSQALKSLEPARLAKPRWVWVGETPEDLGESRRQVVGSLLQAGFTVLPSTPYPWTDGTLLQSELAADLRRALVAVQLLGPTAGFRPEWAADGMVAIQASAVEQESDRRLLPVLRWRPRELDLGKVANGHLRLLQSREVRTCGLAEFQADLARELAPARATPARVRSGHPLPPLVRKDLPTPSTPYRGLRPFTVDDAAVFFGREAHVERLLEILERERFLAVLGPSGAGKSSLVQAGLLPLLQQYGSPWRTTVLRPGDRPLERLAEALSGLPEIAGDLPPTELRQGLLEAELRRGPRGLALLGARGTRSKDPWQLLVLVDQFEELFRYASVGSRQADESEAFVNLLLAARADADCRISVALTLRSDFVGLCASFLDLPEVIDRAQFLVPRLAREPLLQAISAPAERFGARVEPALASELANTLGQDFDQLPLLQHLLARLWVHASAKRQPVELRLEDLSDLGGVSGALSGHAEELFRQLSAPQQVLAERLFRAITTREGTGGSSSATRRPLQLGAIALEVESTFEELSPIVQLFAQEEAGFLQPVHPLRPESVVDVAHEALLRQWERLRAWVDDEAEHATEYRRLRDRAELHQAGGELLVGQDLLRARTWYLGRDGWQPTLNWARRYVQPERREEPDPTFQYLEASEAAEEEERARAKAAEEKDRKRELERLAALAHAEAQQARAARRQRSMAVTAALVALALMGVALWFRFEAASRAREALARQLLSDGASVASADPDRYQLLTLEAYRVHPTEEVRGAVREAYSRHRHLRSTLRGHDKMVTTAAFSPDGTQVLTSSFDQTAKLWHTSTGALAFSLEGHAAPIIRAAFSPDGRSVATADIAGAVRIWRTVDGKPGPPLAGHASSIVDVAFSPDSTYLASTDRDQTTRLWSSTTGLLLGTPKEVNSWVAPRFLPNRPGLVSLDRAGKFLELNLPALTVRRTLAARGTSPRPDSGFSIDPHGRLLVRHDKDLAAEVIDLTSGQTRAALEAREGQLVDATFSPDGASIVTSHLGGVANIWDAASGELKMKLDKHSGQVWQSQFSPNGEMVLTKGRSAETWVWDTRSGEQVAALTGHGGDGTAASFSPDGTLVVSAGTDGTARIYNAPKPTQRTLVSAPVASLPGPEAQGAGEWMIPFQAVGADMLVSVELDQEVDFWRLADGQRVRRLRPLLPGGRGSSFALSPDGRLLAAQNEAGESAIFDAETGNRIRSLPKLAPNYWLLFGPNSQVLVALGKQSDSLVWNLDRPSDPPRRLLLESLRAGLPLFSNNSRWLLNFTRDQKATVLDLTSGNSWSTQVSGRNSLQPTAFSPDSQYLALATTPAGGQILETRSGKLVASLERSGSEIRALAFRPDRRALVGLTARGEVLQWDPTNGRLIRTMPSEAGDGAALSFSPDGKLLATTHLGNFALLWDAETLALHKKLIAYDRFLWSLSFDFEGKALVAQGSDGDAYVWEVPSGRPIAVLGRSTGLPARPAIGPDGETLLVARGNQDPSLIDVRSGQVRAVLPGHRGPVKHLALDHTGRIALTASWDGTARLWKADTGAPAGVLAGHESSLRHAVFSPDGKWIATASADGTARIWDADLATLQTTLREGEAQVRAVAFSPDSTMLVTASDDSTAQVWHVEGGSLRSRLEGHKGPVMKAVFGPSGETVLTASRDGTARLWSTSSGQLVAELVGHEDGLLDARFSADGRWIATASADGTARLWNGRTGKPGHILRGHTGRVGSVNFTQDGLTLVTAGEDDVARLWDVPTGKLLEELRSAAGDAMHHDRDSLRTAEFVKDDTEIVTLLNRRVELWPCAVCRPVEDLAEAIRKRVGRELTAAERAQSGLPPTD